MNPAVEVQEQPTTVRVVERYAVEVQETVQQVRVTEVHEVTVQEAVQTVRVSHADVTVQVGSETVSVVEVGTQGPQGIPGIPGIQGPPGTGSGRLEFRFDWGDATPKTLLTVPADKLVERVAIHVVEPFDGAGAALTIGDSDDPDRLLRATDNDPTTAGTYEVRPNLEYGSPTAVNLYITPGSGASAGSGLVILDMEQ